MTTWAASTAAKTLKSALSGSEKIRLTDDGATSKYTTPSAIAEYANGNATEISVESADPKVYMRDTDSDAGRWMLNCLDVYNQNDGGIHNHTIGLHYNLDPEDNSQRENTNHPHIGFNWEPDFYWIGGYRQSEHNWSYISTDGSVNYRPFAWLLRHDNHNCWWDWTGEQMRWRHRSASEYTWYVTPTSTGNGSGTFKGNLVVTHATGTTLSTPALQLSVDMDAGVQAALWDINNPTAEDTFFFLRSTSVVTGALYPMQTYCSASSVAYHQFQNNTGSVEFYLYGGSTSGKDAYFRMNAGGLETYVGVNSSTGMFEISTNLPSNHEPMLAINPSTKNIGFNMGFYGFGGGQGVIAIKNCAAAPISQHADGGILYVDGGALKYRGNAGTVTTIAAA